MTASRILLLGIGLTLMGQSVLADLYITVSGANVKKARLAVGKLHGIEKAVPDPQLSHNIRTKVLSNLELTGLFEFINEDRFSQLDKGDLYTLKFDEWGLSSASFVLRMAYEVRDGFLILEGLLYDVAGEKKIFGTRYKHPVAQYHRLVHALVEDILKELTGERGLFHSRILMICREPGSKNKEVYITDVEGDGFSRVTFDKTLTLSPAWSPDAKHISYTQFERRLQNRRYKTIPVLKAHNLVSGERKVISEREGMNSGAAWSPKGGRIAATLSYSGRPELYLLKSDGSGEPEALSRHIQWKRISGEGFQPNFVTLLFDVEPSWAPDGEKIVFSSARTGHPMIYIVDLPSRVANQLTFAGTYNATPAWAPRGDKIVFAAQRTKEGHFELYTIDPDGNNLARLTSGERGTGKRYNNENPSWAPTSRHLALASNESGKYGVYVMTYDGGVRKRISPPHLECNMPAWGPAE